MIHAKLLATTTSYNISLGVTEDLLNDNWNLNYSVDFWTFRDILSIQMLEYNPSSTIIMLLISCEFVQSNTEMIEIRMIEK